MKTTSIHEMNNKISTSTHMTQQSLLEFY